MQHPRAWSTLRPLAVDGAPQQAAVMLRGLLATAARQPAGPSRTHTLVALHVEIAFAEMLSHDFAGALVTARRAREDAADASCTEPGPRALAAAMWALAQLSVAATDANGAQPIADAVDHASGLVSGFDPRDEHARMANYYLAESERIWGRFSSAETAARRALTAALGVDTTDPADLVAVL